jgi:hypothetical protein
MKNLFLTCLLGSCLGAGAQVNDTAFMAQAANHARALHSSRITGESLLFNGSDFVRYIPLHEEFPYYLSDEFLNGTITYDDQRYEEVFLLYDITTDEVIVENYNFAYNIRLIKNRIQDFTLEGHRFINVNHPSLPAGFYELLYDGPTQVLAKHTKRFTEEIRFGELYRNFIPGTTYYILKDNQYRVATNQATVLKLLKDHRPELRSHLRDTGINFSADREHALTTLAKFYDELSK